MIELPYIGAGERINTLENDLTRRKKISLSVLRLDRVDAEISGNKLFKLWYFLKEAVASSHKKIITFGGTWSNHLAATAKACRISGIDCIGIVRGEEPARLSHTLLFCREQGMQLRFISRQEYTEKNKVEFLQKLKDQFHDHTLIPEGGFDPKGMQGAELISGLYNKKKYSHICCPVGSATTLAGLVNSSTDDQQIIGFSALKEIDDFLQRMQFLNVVKNNYSLVTDYHFGGYAKKNNELIVFMNNFYEEFGIPTDFVYTGKMMFGVFDAIENNFLPENSTILCIHTGGLQGNISLPPGTLNF